MSHHTRNRILIYAAVQFESNTYEQHTNYLVICSNWIISSETGNFFYWPNKSWLQNKLAVQNCDSIDYSSWIKVHIKTIVMYSDDLYDVIHCCVTLSYFGIDAFEVPDFADRHLEMSDHFDSSQCSDMTEIRKLSQSLSCQDTDVEIQTDESISDDYPSSPDLFD